ncbi:MAG: SH3 domain-containing protein [Candidatus Shapirobacteria bacterium]
MFKQFLILILASFFLSGCSLLPKKSTLEISSYPVAKVFIDNKEMGMTPYKNNSLKPGIIEVKLKTNDQEWVKKIDLKNNINTVVDWEFGNGKESSGGYVLFLEKTGDAKKSSLMVNVVPDKSVINIDSEIKGVSPLRFNTVNSGDRQLVLSASGYKDLSVFVKAINGYQLVIDATLAQEISPKINEIQASTPTVNSKKVVIKETGTGWLRVREQANNGSKEIVKVKPTESYPILEEGTDWYKIDLGNNKSGWVSAKYVSIVE